MNTPHETILIADDEKIVRQLLIHSLSAAGYTCIEASNADEALEQLKKYEVSIALLDIKMPKKSGIELLSEVMAGYPDIAVIMISAVSNSETAIACMRQGAFDYIIKPFNPPEIVLRVEYALEKRKLRLDNKVYQLNLEQKVEEQTGKLRASEENFRNSLDNSPLGIRIVDEDGQTLYANRAFLNIYGYSSIAALDAVPYKARHTPESYAAHLERILKRSRGESVVSPYEINVVRRNGEIRRLAVNRGEVLWNGEKQYQMLYEDITERKQAEEELQKAANLESIITLAGGIAHDFNNLLTGILGNITLADRYTEKNSKAHNMLIEAEKASLRAKDLTQQLLTFSRGGTPIKKPTSIRELLRESTKFALSGSNVRCEFFLPNDLWAAEIDEAQISRVINNVVINADQAMPQGGLISISAANLVVSKADYPPLPEGKYLKITIKDTGVGISKEYLAKIFEPYFTTKKKGSGLGLATSYSIVKNHDGYITVESKLGVGTTVYIYLPATSEPVQVSIETENGEDIGSRGYILVMDDEEMIRDLLHNSLSEAGYKVETAADGREAVEKYAERQKSGECFDAVILDLTIPGGMGGEETIKKLLEINPKVKAIVSSGYANDAVIANFKKYGFSGIVTKPYNITALEKTLRDVMYPPVSAKISQNDHKPLKNSGTGKTKILIMDDTQVVLNALGEYLPDLGYEVEFAKNGDDAISVYRKALNSGHLFDVVLMDLHVAHGLGGEGTIQRLIEEDPDVRVIVTSGYPAEAAMITPQKFGFKAAITKPYRIEELGEIIQKVLQGEN